MVRMTCHFTNSCMIKSVALWCHHNEHHPAMRLYVAVMSSISLSQRLATNTIVNEMNCYSCCHNRMFRWVNFTLIRLLSPSLSSFCQKQTNEQTDKQTRERKKSKKKINNEMNETNVMTCQKDKVLFFVASVKIQMISRQSHLFHFVCKCGRFDWFGAGDAPTSSLFAFFLFYFFFFLIPSDFVCRSIFFAFHF